MAENLDRWYETYFSDLRVELQDKVRDSAQTEAEAAFVRDVLELVPGMEMLDVPCGVGRISIELAAQGCKVAGVDLTLAFIDLAIRRAAARRVQVGWECRDMRDLPWEARFDAVLCFWGSFGYFDDAGNETFLHAVARVLKPGGRFLLDTHVMETLLPRMRQRRDWYEVGDLLVLEDREFDVEARRTRTRWTLIREGRPFQRDTSSIRLYAFEELRELVESTGLKVEEAYGSLGKEPFGFDSPRLYLVASKR